MIRWVSIQPLIGGHMLGAERAFGCPPLFNIDYKDVADGNSSAYLYYQNVIHNKGIRELRLDGKLTSYAMDFVNEEDTNYFNANCHDIDVVTAVPICSGLSKANTSSGDCPTARGADAIQNANMLGITSFALGKIKPKAYIFENAPALFSVVGEPLREKFAEIAREYEYSVSFVKTNTMLHGTPQNRPRTFCIFWKSQFVPDLYRIRKECPRVSEYISNIPETATCNGPKHNMIPGFTDACWYKYLNKKFGTEWRKHYTNRPFFTVVESDKDWENLCELANEKELKFINHVKYKLSLGKNFMDAYTPFLRSDACISTIFHRAMHTLVHPVEDRGFTIREFMRLMGMPDDFTWPSIEENYLWLSQNVPVTTSCDWHTVIKEFIENKLTFTRSEVVMFDNTAAEEKTLKSKKLF